MDFPSCRHQMCAEREIERDLKCDEWRHSDRKAFQKKSRISLLILLVWIKVNGLREMRQRKVSIHIHTHEMYRPHLYDYDACHGQQGHSGLWNCLLPVSIYYTWPTLILQLALGPTSDNRVGKVGEGHNSFGFPKTGNLGLKTVTPAPREGKFFAHFSP